MSKVKTPQDKKRISLLKDRRNSYGENSKSSRKNIPLNKQLGSQAQRAQVMKLKGLLNQGVDEDFASEVESNVKDSYRLQRLRGFKKSPDQTLEDHIAGQLERRD